AQDGVVACAAVDRQVQERNAVLPGETIVAGLHVDRQIFGGIQVIEERRGRVASDSRDTYAIVGEEIRFRRRTAVDGDLVDTVTTRDDAARQGAVRLVERNVVVAALAEYLEDGGVIDRRLGPENRHGAVVDDDLAGR